MGNTLEARHEAFALCGVCLTRVAPAGSALWASKAPMSLPRCSAKLEAHCATEPTRLVACRIENWLLERPLHI